jgi:hypothetical protein
MDAPNRIDRTPADPWVLLPSPSPEEEHKEVEQTPSAPQSLLSSIYSYIFTAVSEEDALKQECRSVLEPLSIDDPIYMNQLDKILEYPALHEPFKLFLQEAGKAKGSDSDLKALLAAKENFIDEMGNLCQFKSQDLPTLSHLLNNLVISDIIDATVHKLRQGINFPDKYAIKDAKVHTHSITNNPMASIFEKVLINRGYLKYATDLFWTKCRLEENKLIIGLAVPFKKEVEIAVAGDASDKTIREGLAQIFKSLATTDEAKIPESVKDNTADMQAEAFLMVHNLLARIHENFNVELSSEFIEDNFKSLETAKAFETYLASAIKTKNLHKALKKHREPLNQGSPAIKEMKKAQKQLLIAGQLSEELEQLVEQIDCQTGSETKYSAEKKAAFDLCDALGISQWSTEGKKIWTACADVKNDDDGILFIGNFNNFLQTYRLAYVQNRDYPHSAEAYRLTNELGSRHMALGDMHETLAKAVKTLVKKSYDPCPSKEDAPLPEKYLETFVFPNEIDNIMRNPASHFDDTAEPINVDGQDYTLTDQIYKDINRQQVLVNDKKVSGTDDSASSKIQELIRELHRLGASRENIEKALRYCDQGITAGEIAMLDHPRYMTCSTFLGGGGLAAKLAVDDSGEILLTVEVQKNIMNFNDDSQCGFMSKIICDFDGYDNGDIYVIHSTSSNR